MEIVRARAARVDYVNGWRFILADGVWALPGVEDVTQMIRDAAVQPVAAPPVIKSIAPVVSVETTGHTDDPTWSSALARYDAPRTLLTLARHRPFEVRAGRDELVITPETGRPRRVFAAEFLKVAELLTQGLRQELPAVTFNSSYLEAIVGDLRTRNVSSCGVARAAP